MMSERETEREKIPERGWRQRVCEIETERGVKCE